MSVPLFTILPALSHHFYIIVIRASLLSSCHEQIKQRVKRHSSSPNEYLLYLISNHPLRMLWESQSRKLATVLDVFGKQLRMVRQRETGRGKERQGEKEISHLFGLKSIFCRTIK